MKNLFQQLRRRRFELLEFLTLALLMSSMSIPRAVRGDELKAYRCGTAEGERAVMTIVLPQEWSYEPAKQSRLHVQKFVFTHSSGPYPYLWAEIESSSAQTLKLRLEQAQEHSSRELLSGGTTGETYYDSSRQALWSRSKDDHGTAGVSVTLFSTHVGTFRFFDRRAHLSELEPQIVAIIDHLRLHSSDEDVLATVGDVPLPEGVDTAAFRRTSTSGGFPYLLCLTTVAVVGGLAAIERHIRLKRHQAKIAEIEQAQAERNSRATKREYRESHAANEYLQATGKRRHLRRE